jgi:NADH-quinone oxidoreductase subunit K
MFERLLIVSAVLFCIGLYGVLSRRHIIAVLISVEIMFNGVNVALVAFSRFVEPAVVRLGQTGSVAERAVLTGQSLALFAIVVAAAEVALGLALVIAMVRRRDNVDVTEVSVMRQ